MKRLLYLLLATVWAASIFIIYMGGGDRVEGMLADSLSENEEHLSKLFYIASAYNTAIQHQMESNLQQVKNPNYNHTHPLLKELNNHSELGAYSLNHKIVFEDKIYHAMLTGAGTIDELSKETKAEISAALSLSLSAPLESKYYNFFWSYYVSKERFILIAPAISMDKFRYTDKLHTQPYWVAALPNINPNRETIFTKVFKDEAGQGLIMSIANPIYDKDTFKGVVSLDLGLTFILDELRPHSDVSPDFMSVITEGGMTVSRTTTNLDIKPIQAKTNSMPPLQLIQQGENFVISSNLIVGKFNVIYTLPSQSLRWLIFNKIKTEVFISTLLAVIVALMIKLGYALSRSRQESRYDGLSKVYNRLTLELLANKAFLSTQKTKGIISLIMIDIDDFKRINDNFGHAIGDEGIKFVADKISNSIRKTDIVGRYGGEEFLVVLPNTESKKAIAIAEKIRKDIEHSFFNKKIHITISAGCAEYTTKETQYDFLSLCEKADLALYQAKKNGKNCVSLYTQESEKYNKRDLNPTELTEHKGKK